MNSLFIIVFLAVVAITAARIVRYGGVTGMFVGARTQAKLGKIEGKAVGSRRVTLGVRRLEGDRPLGIDFTGRAFMSVERMAGSLSREDARRLAEALETAATEKSES